MHCRKTLSVFRTLFSAFTALLVWLIHVLPSAAQQPEINKPAINYREPAREYETVRRGGLVVHVEKQLAIDSPALAQQGITRLSTNVGLALSALPAHAKPLLKKIPLSDVWPEGGEWRARQRA